MAQSSLALGRSRRSTAGAKMAKLLDNEEEDEFYKSTYGGFNEVFYDILKYIINYLNNFPISI